MSRSFRRLTLDKSRTSSLVKFLEVAFWKGGSLRELGGHGLVWMSGAVRPEVGTSQGSIGLD